MFLRRTKRSTYGTPSDLPWGHDFGDGIFRHPVQLYESFAMAGFLAFALAMLARRNPFFLRNGFYLMVLFYAAQRFIWEFLKPYAPLCGPFNLFHFICAGLVCYSSVHDGQRRPMNAPIRKISHYLFHGQTTSLCESCLALVPAKIVIEDGQRLSI